MPRDALGVELVAGDVVYVPCIITNTTENLDYINLEVETERLFFPDKSRVGVKLNSKQVIKVYPFPPIRNLNREKVSDTVTP